MLSHNAFIYIYNINYIISGTLFLLAITSLKVTAFNFIFTIIEVGENIVHNNTVQKILRHDLDLMWGNPNY